jgi:hypothetical protein
MLTMEILVTAVSTAALSFLGQLILYMGFVRRAQKNDREFRDLKRDLDSFREKELSAIKQRIDEGLSAAYAGRQKIHERVNECPTRGECERRQNDLMKGFGRIEKTIERNEALFREEMRDLRARVDWIGQSTAAQQAQIDDLQKG